MPRGRSTTRPAPARSTGAPAPAPAPTLDRRQQSVGNAAVQDRVASQGQTGAESGGPGGGIAAAQGALRDSTHSASVSVSGRLPANALLGESDGNQLSTGAATGFNVGVGRSGLWARFHPALLARPGGFWQRMATRDAGACHGRARPADPLHQPGDPQGVAGAPRRGDRGRARRRGAARAVPSALRTHVGDRLLSLLGALR